MSTSRRSFCQAGFAALAGLSLAPAAGLARIAGGQSGALSPGTSSGRRKIAAITVRYGLRLHADNLVTRLLEGYWINDRFHEPRCEIASLYVHHLSDYAPDVSQRLADAYRFRSSPTIADALTLGTGRLAVDGVLIVSEDGLTPWRQNPFLSFYSQVVDVFQRSGRSVPVLNDKALSCDWNEAQWMVRQSCELNFPLLAGSTVPITFRRPELDFPVGTRFEEALVAATLPGAYVESIGYHCIELLQAMVERRAGGETGIRSVQCLEGPAVWEAAERGLWSRHLFDAAIARSESRSEGRPEDLIREPFAFLIEYRDGFRGSVIGAGGLVRDFNFAARIHAANEPQSTLAYIPWENSNNFGVLVNYFEQMMDTGKPAFPIQRNLLAAGALDFLMRSRADGNRRLETPELMVTYQAPKVSAFARGPGS